MKKTTPTFGFDPILAKPVSTFIDREALEGFGALYPEIDISPYQEEKWKTNVGCPVYSMALKNIIDHWAELNSGRDLEPHQREEIAKLLACARGGPGCLAPQDSAWLILCDKLMKCVQKKIEKALKSPATPISWAGVPGFDWRKGLAGWPDGPNVRGLTQFEMVEWVLPCKKKIMREDYGIRETGVITPGTGFPLRRTDVQAWPLIGDEAISLGWGLSPVSRTWPPQCTCPPLKSITLFIVNEKTRNAHYVTVMPPACDDGNPVVTDVPLPGWDNPAQLPGGGVPPPAGPQLRGDPTYTLTINNLGVITGVVQNPGIPPIPPESAISAGSRVLVSWC